MNIPLLSNSLYEWFLAFVCGGYSGITLQPSAVQQCRDCTNHLSSLYFTLSAYATFDVSGQARASHNDAKVFTKLYRFVNKQKGFCFQKRAIFWSDAVADGYLFSIHPRIDCDWVLPFCLLLFLVASLARQTRSRLSIINFRVIIILK